MKRSLIAISLMLLSFIPCKSYATIVDIAEFDLSAFASKSGIDLFAPVGNQPGFFTVGFGDFDYFTMFAVYSNDVGHTLSYWNGPPILPGVDTGNYFIRTITGYNFKYDEARAFGSQIPMNYGFNLGAGSFGIHHDVVPNPRLDDVIINGIYLDVIGTSIDGIQDVSTRLYADVDADAGVVPEPATLILFAFGAAGIGFLKKSRNRDVVLS